MIWIEQVYPTERRIGFSTEAVKKMMEKGGNRTFLSAAIEYATDGKGTESHEPDAQEEEPHNDSLPPIG